EVRTFKKPLAGAEVVSPPLMPSLPAANAFKARLLIADDNAEVAQYMQHLLAPLADVRIAEDGDQALDIFYEWRPHVVVADVRMPGMNGIDLCRQLKGNEETAAVPVVLLSALTNRETMLRGWESGADDYLFKPFHPTELVTRLQSLISRIHERSKFDQRIQSLNKALEQRVSELDTVNEELRWLTKELQTARDHAVAAAQTKSQFLSNMSHEIRTPLNGLIATAELLLQTELSDEQREFVTISRESALVLLETVNDLLDFSRVESGKLSLDQTDFDVLGLVEGAAELMSHRAREKHLSLMTHVSRDVPSKLYGDPARLRQVLINLLSNAVKFTEHGEVVCRVTVESQSQARVQVRFSVYDTGVGMPRAMQRTLFEPFFQADSSMTRQKAGAGLGLSIARRLVELMDGTLGVDSTEGQGSTFWFVVPLENRADENAPNAVPETLRNLRVLTVNGPPETQKVIHEYARCWHMTCTSADTASEALAVMGRWHASHKPFDLVIVDFSISDMHPFTFARYVRNSPDLNGTKLMLLTSGEEEGRGERALKCGYAAYLTKPIKQSQLFDCLSNVMQGHSIFEPVQIAAVEGRRGDETLQLPPNEPANPLILVVEDNAVNQRVARLQLEELGYRVHIVGNGREALEATTRLRYDLILMDCAMPEMDGYEATSRIRKQEALIGRHTPIIALTAHSMPGDRERCLECGMDDYLSKPIAKDELGQAIKRWLKFHRGIDAPRAGKTPGGKTAGTNGTTTGGPNGTTK
ncbi:MAG TPA: response regulator, partial [Candidatus Obscuribacterales bacterium]